MIHNTNHTIITVSQNIINKNLDIARFLGCEIIEDYGRIYVKGKFFQDNPSLSKYPFIRDSQLMFHSDWNWLMPVIKACHVAAPPSSEYWSKSDRIKYVINFSSFLNNDVLWTWASVVEFVSWYNERKNKQ